MAEAPSGAARVGVIVNPIAGMGGTVALHGTDGDAAARAASLGAVPGSEERMRRSLDALATDLAHGLVVLAAAGRMGETSAAAAGIDIVGVVGSPHEPTTADDTRAAAVALRDAGIDLLLFAGGDGTAADIVGAVGTSVVVLGIPSGVKMHSGVFAHTPERAGHLAAAFLAAAQPRTIDTEVVDVTPGGEQPATIGTARVPRTAFTVQGPKVSRSAATAGEVIALGEQFAADMRPGVAYLLGPGTTVGTILTALGLEGTANGFDVVIDRRIVARDASETELFDHVRAAPRSVLVLGVVGGQGFLLGRGNQQVSPRVLRMIDDADVVILAAQDKIDALQPPVLHVDLGTAEPHVALRGYRRVLTSPTRSTILRVES